MRIRLFVVLLLLGCPAFSFPQQLTTLVVPGSPFPLGSSFLFSNQASNSLILLYERRSESSQSLKVEIRRPLDLKILRQFSIPMEQNQQLRLADYRQPLNAILAVVQDKTTGSLQSLRISLNAQTAARFPISSSDKSVPAAVTWNSSQQKWAMITNEGSISALITIDSSGRQTGRSLVMGGGGKLIDITFNSCNSQLAVISAGSVRSPGGSVRSIATPVEISFDPDHCQYRLARILNGVTPQVLLLNSSLKIESTISLPGQIAEGLIADSRSEFAFSKARQSLFYPTVGGHIRFWINEIKNGQVRSRFVITPVDSRLSMAVLRNRVFLLVSGLTELKTTHRLALVKVPAPDSL